MSIKFIGDNFGYELYPEASQLYSKDQSNSEEERLLNIVFPISKEEASKVYSRLDANWWQQVFDGKYHHLGEKVFDEGLNRSNRKEPGFYASALNAFNFAKKHLCEPLTVDFYQEIHKIACAHFQGIKNNTQMEASEAGKFRDSSKFQEAKMSIDGLLISYLEEASKDTSKPAVNLKDLHDWIDNIYASSKQMTIDWARADNPQTTLTIEKIERLTELKEQAFIKLNGYWTTKFNVFIVFSPFGPFVLGVLGVLIVFCLYCPFCMIVLECLQNQERKGDF